MRSSIFLRVWGMSPQTPPGAARSAPPAPPPRRPTTSLLLTSGHGLRRSKPTMSLPVKLLQSLRRGFDHGNKEGETRRSAAAVWQEVFVDTAKYVDWGLRVGCSALRVKTMFSQWGQKTKKSNLEEPAAAAAATGEDGEGGEERNLEAAAAAGSANAAGEDGQGVEVEVILDDVTSVTPDSVMWLHMQDDVLYDGSE